MKNRTLIQRIVLLGLLIVPAMSLLMPRTVLASNAFDPSYPAGLVSYWKFEESSGTTASDPVSGNSGTIMRGGAWVPGQVGGALQFDGVDDYMVVANAPNLNPAQISLEVWVNLSANAPYWGTALMEKDGWVAGQTGFALLLGGWGRNNVVCFEIFNPWTTAYSTTELELNRWYHIVATYDQTATRIYIDGVLDGQAAASQPIGSGSNGLLGTGGRFTDTGLEYETSFLSGMVDEMALWNRALTPAEITQHYQNGLNGYGYDEAVGRLVASPVSADVYPGDMVSVDLNIEAAEDLYAAQALCSVDPAVLDLQGGTFGDFFDTTDRLVAANQADALAGEWLGAISQQNPAGPLSGDGLYATLDYVAAAPGTTELACEPLFSDRNGFALPATFTGIDITVIPFGIVDGQALYQGRLSHAGIQVTATGPVSQTVVTDETGAFALDQLETGSYLVQADAALYLPVCAEDVTVASGETMTLDPALLPGGDLNDDDGIDIGDFSRLGAGFNTADPGADVNADGGVNIYDLAILAGNYGLAGCQDW